MQTVIKSTHECWWTNRGKTELVDVDGRLSGAGIPPEVLAHTALLMGEEFAERTSITDEYGKDVCLGAVVTGSIHDDCFIILEPASVSLKRALLESVLALHSSYLAKDVDWSAVLGPLMELWMPGTTLSIRANDRRCRVSVQSFRNGATFIEKLFKRLVIVDCATGVGLLNRTATVSHGPAS